MMTKVCRVPDVTHDEWLEYRRTGIGGSDASTIVGLNPYSSLYYLYCDKLGQMPPKETSEAMRIGHDLEQYVADRWMEATGKRCQRNNYMWRSTEHPWMLADIDREIVGENAGLECKTTSVYSRYDFDSGEVPPTYYVQCMHYMAVMGFERMYLAVLVLGKGFYHYTIDRDEGEISALVDKERIFWEENVLPQHPPELDGSGADMTALRQQYKTEGQDLPVLDLMGSAHTDLAYRAAAKQQIKELQAQVDACEARIMAQMCDYPLARTDRWAVSWKTQARTTVDTAKLKRLHPDIYAECTKHTSARVFRVKEYKED